MLQAMPPSKHAPTKRPEQCDTSQKVHARELKLLCHGIKWVHKDCLALREQTARQEQKVTRVLQEQRVTQVLQE
jgi:hypothetical protein